MSHPAIRHFVVCGLMLVGPYAYASGNITAFACEQKKKAAIKKCQDKITSSSTSEKAKTDAFGAQCQANPNTRDCALGFGGLGASAKKAIGDSITECRSAKKDCDSGCDPAKAVDNTSIGGTNHKPEVTAKKKECNDSVDGLINRLNTELARAGGAEQGGTKTADSSTGQGQNQAGQQQGSQQGSPQQQPQQQPQSQPQSTPPQTPPQQAQQQPPAATDPNKQAAENPCNGPNANLYAQCKGVVAEKCKSQSPGAVGFGQPDPACEPGAGGTQTASATCARFQQQCAKDTQGCLKTMSATDRARIQSECLNGSTASGGEAIRQGTAGFGTASVTAGSPGGGGGGGASVGTSDGATLDEIGKLKGLADGLGEREGTGDNLRVDAAGGYSNSVGGDSSSESSLNLGSASPSSVTRSVASQMEGPSAANATDVDNRYGPSVFSIQSSVLKDRCTKGRLLHCQPSLK